LLRIPIIPNHPPQRAQPQRKFHARSRTPPSFVVRFDVIVAGAGPGGAEAARAAARAGLRTLLAEEHPTVGVPSHCTGKLSYHAFDEFDIPRSLALNAVSAAVFHSPGGVAVRVRRATVDSYVVDRVLFDRSEERRVGKECRSRWVPNH